MLKLKNIEKNYYVGENVIRALRGVSLEFRKNEFVAILGPSGCGKTTLLNIIGGLDKYSKGDLLINGKSTKRYTDYDWDTYRNHSIGFVFQSYNLIPHQSVLNNVELALTLSGISKSERKKKAIKALESVGLHDQIYKKPNQLSGGQMQRVAIARALVNDPEIILADEPTGALDSETSKQIMEILKEISKDRLIIMVTHNPDIANTYATRIIRLLDGLVTDDSNPYNTEDVEIAAETKKEKKARKQYQKHTAMNFITALSLSLQNLFTKKGRTLLTAFAGSIGIIGISLVLALSYGFQSYVDKMQSDTLSAYPLTISDEATDYTAFFGAEYNMPTNKFPEEEKIYLNKISEFLESANIKNDITDEYIENVINTIDTKLYNSIKYRYGVNVNVFKESEFNNIKTYRGISFSNFSEIAVVDGEDPYEFFKSQYDVIGSNSRLPENMNEVVLVVDQYNQITDLSLMAIGIDESGDENGAIDFDKIIGHKYMLVLNDVLYDYDGTKFTNNIVRVSGINFISEELYNHEDNIELTIVGIVRPNKQTEIGSIDSGAVLAYSPELTNFILDKAQESEIIKWMNEEENLYKNPYTAEDYIQAGEKTPEQLWQDEIARLGGTKKPVEIVIYAKDFESKNLIKEHLDKYNEEKKQEAINEYYQSIGVTHETATREQRREAEKIGKAAGVYYVDLMAVLVTSLNTLVNAISIVLIIFTSISLVVSSIMIGIITYISVLERTKEIGILRSIGARKKDISRVFNAETLIIGFTAGLIGISITALLSIPANLILSNLVNIENLVKVNPLHAIILILISMALTLIAGLIPSRLAAKKDPVIALRTE